MSAVSATDPTFGEDLAFLREHTAPVVLRDAQGRAQVVVVPAYQGRVMTSTAGGPAGLSFGWIHRDAIKSGRRTPHMNVFGGEERLWLGPEGGQFSIYFEPGAPFDLAHWQVPEPIDWGPWTVTEEAATRVSLRRDMELMNYGGAVFSLRVERTVRLLSPDDMARHLGGGLSPDVRAVAYESVNTLTNTGATSWRKERGLLSIWILGMYKPSPATTVVVPFVAGGEALGRVVNDNYFGEVPADRLLVSAEEGLLFFRGDGRMRGKIGVPRPRAKPWLGSYDGARGLLTLVQYTLPEGEADYVNSLWELQADPYGGDVVNSYNDGPPAPGQPPLGPFYELETSSPAVALAPETAVAHTQRTFHLVAPRAALDGLARRLLGVDLARIEAAFGDARGTDSAAGAGVGGD